MADGSTRPPEEPAPQPPETGGERRAPKEVHTNPPTGEKDTTQHAQPEEQGKVYTREEAQALVEHMYNEGHTEELKQKLEEYGFSEDVKEFTRMQLFPREYDDGEIKEFIGNFNEKIQKGKDEHPDLEEALKRNAIHQEELKAKQESQQQADTQNPSPQESPTDEAETKKNSMPEIKYEALDDAFKRDLRDKGLTEENAKLLCQYMYDRDSLSQQEKDQIETIVSEHPDLVERAKQEFNKPAPTSTPDETPLTEEEQESINKEQRKMQQISDELDAAMQAYKDDPLDVDKQRTLHEKMAEARKHHAEYDKKHGADALQKGTPRVIKFLTALGVAFYLYVGAQYLMAAAVENTMGGKK